jgi:Tol biopolymer transport system component
LHLRSLDAFDGRGLPGTEGALGATFARDSRWILFSAGGKLKKVALAGGSVQVIADMRQFFGVDTTLDGRLIYTPDYNKGLARVAGDGGDPEVLTTPDQARHELGHWWPQVLPDGESVLFTGYTTPLDRARIGAYSFQTRKEITVLEGATNGHYLSSGYLAYFRKGALQVAPFDMKRLTITGSPVVLQDEVGFDGSSSTLRASFSDSGILAYQSARDTRVPRQLIAVDTSNRATALTSLARPYGQPRVAADGRRVAVAINEDNRDIWVLDVDRDTPRRITFGMAVKTSPLWTADSRRVIYSVERPAFDLFWTPVDGATAEELLLSSPDDKYATSVTPDGRTLAFTTTTLTTGEDIWLLPLDGERKPRAFRATPFNESQAAFSPDGRWIAYQSDESTRSEVYVEPFPGPGERVAVSAEGGRDPVWARNTKTLFYWNGDRLMAAPMRPGAGATVGRSTEVFRRSREGRLNPQSPEYDVLPDGRFLLVERDASTPPPEFKIVVNWYEELRRRTKPNQ